MNKTRILIVEDDTMLVKSLERKLKAMGYDVPTVASSGEEAVSKAAELRPDLVLMDIRLEGKIDGIEATKRIHALADIPVIYLTAYGDEETLNRAKVTEPFGYILKPFNEKELLIAIETSLYKHHIQRKAKEREQALKSNIEREVEDRTRKLRDTNERLKAEVAALETQIAALTKSSSTRS
jgi:DNA-binding response OmpR family regulator